MDEITVIVEPQPTEITVEISPVGEPGLPGPEGPQGPEGVEGEKGPIGLTGPQGPQGQEGPQGPMGLTGDPGPIGLTGPQGPEGAEGPQGPIGLTGDQGPIGLTGPQGDPGSIGLTGDQGPEGPAGSQGPIGPTGPQGPEGAEGDPGPIGLTGPEGEVGPEGPEGPQGPIGLTGPEGPAGAQGPQGPAGIDATGVLALVDDDFSIDRFANYTFDFSTSKTGLVIANGYVASSDALDHSWHDSSHPISDGAYMLKASNVAANNYTIGLWLKWIDSQNVLMMQFIASAIQIYTFVAGVYTSIASVNISSGTIPGEVYIVGRVSGDWVKAEFWKVDPRYGGSPSASGEVAIPSLSRPILGKGISGYPGVRLTGNNGIGATAARIEDWTVVSDKNRAKF